MFREVTRKNSVLSNEDCISLLKKEPRGVLSVLGDDDYPYGMPMNHWYCEEDGKLYFHSGKTGHKIDAIKKHDKVSFCVYDEGYRKENEWALNIRSVVVFGHIEILEDQAQALEITRKLSYKYTDDAAYIEHEIQYTGHEVLVFALVPEHITGRLVNES